MTTRRTPGQVHARRVLCALARTALDVCDLRAEAGLEDDDRPRMWLTALERWARDEEPPARLAVTTKACTKWRRNSITDDDERRDAADLWERAVWNIDDAASDLRRHPSHVWHDGRVLSALTQSLASTHGAGVTPETVHDAAGRVREVYNKHLRDVERDAAEALAAARRGQAREHAAEAERVLGTVLT